MVPGPSPVRRLSRTQYTATVRDLLNLHVDIGATLPADSAGGEGFDNAAETLFLSPIYAEKYLEAAKFALSYASKDARSRARFLTAAPGPGVTPAAAANTILEEFLPRAFRRPVDQGELERTTADVLWTALTVALWIVAGALVVVVLLLAF